MPREKPAVKKNPILEVKKNWKGLKTSSENGKWIIRMEGTTLYRGTFKEFTELYPELAKKL